MEWQQIGILKDGVNPEFQNSKGVYMWIFPGKPKRIIYIGTSIKFKERPGNYWKEYLSMKHYAFKATTDEDIYQNGMCVSEGQTRQKYHEVIKKMKFEGIFWEPPGDKDDMSQIKAQWEKHGWEEFIKQYYSRVELWGCQIPENSIALEIESRLQIALGYKFRIGYSGNTRQNFLGRPERRDKLKQEEFTVEFHLSDDSPLRSVLDKDSLMAFEDETNKELIRSYFAQENNPDSPF